MKVSMALHMFNNAFLSMCVELMDDTLISEGFILSFLVFGTFSITHVF